MRIAVVQNEPVFGDRDANLAWVEAALLAAPAFDLALLPELFATGYRFEGREELASLAEPVPGGPTCEALQRLAREAGASLCGGLAEEDGGLFYNTAALVGPDGLLFKYRKMHLFDREKELFEPGEGPLTVHEVAGCRVGVMVCFDWIFPETARLLALAGAQVILHPANLVLPYAFTAMSTRALENRVFTVTANRTGQERGLTFVGRSVVWGPRMDERLACPSTPGVWVVDVDPAEADDKLITSRNHVLEDRRPGLYSGLVEEPLL